MLEAPKRAVKFAANDFWGKTYRQTFGAEKMTQGLSVLTGCSAGATESIVVVPFELVKIRLQDKNSTYKGPMDVVAQIIKKEGVFGMYAGLEPTFWRSVFASFSLSLSTPLLLFDTNAYSLSSHVSWNGGYFGCIFQVRSLMPKAQVSCNPFSLFRKSDSSSFGSHMNLIRFPKNSPSRVNCSTISFRERSVVSSVPRSTLPVRRPRSKPYSLFFSPNEQIDH